MTSKEKRNRSGGVCRTGCTVALVWLAAIYVAGCSEIRLEAGRRPDTNLLETTLRVGVSTMADVRTALGESVGKGGVMLPVLDARPRETWTYYFEEGHVKAKQNQIDAVSRRIFLFVYFDRGLYDGYLWFSSLPRSGSP